MAQQFLSTALCRDKDQAEAQGAISVLQAELQAKEEAMVVLRQKLLEQQTVNVQLSLSKHPSTLASLSVSPPSEDLAAAHSSEEDRPRAAPQSSPTLQALHTTSPLPASPFATASEAGTSSGGAFSSAETLQQRSEIATLESRLLQSQQECMEAKRELHALKAAYADSRALTKQLSGHLDSIPASPSRALTDVRRPSKLHIGC